MSGYFIGRCKKCGAEIHIHLLKDRKTLKTLRNLCQCVIDGLVAGKKVQDLVDYNVTKVVPFK